MATRFDSGWDISVDDRKGQLVLTVQVKRKFNTSPEWAAQFRSNILAHGIFPKTPYFLMVFPDKFYLWTNVDAEQDQSQPTYAIDGASVLQPYLQRAGISIDQIGDDGIKLILTSWLGEIIYSRELPESIKATQPWLLESGLYAAIAGGKFEPEAAA